MFRRRRRDQPDIPDEDFLVEDEEPAKEHPVDPGAVTTAGPWDVADAPVEEGTRLDLGSLLVPVEEDMEVRIEVAGESEGATATLMYDDGALQLNAFAAPRHEGLWDEVRGEIAASIKEAGGTSAEAVGPFGPELHANVPSDPGQGLQAARFLGANGPRWFLRGVVTGPAATDAAKATRLEEAFRSVVVVRGTEAMAPRDALALRLPKEAVDAAEAAPPGLGPLERGPEITEIH